MIKQIIIIVVVLAVLSFTGIIKFQNPTVSNAINKTVGTTFAKAKAVSKEIIK